MNKRVVAALVVGNFFINTATTVANNYDGLGIEGKDY